jgi:hypothetical protein
MCLEWLVLWVILFFVMLERSEAKHPLAVQEILHCVQEDYCAQRLTHHICHSPCVPLLAFLR